MANNNAPKGFQNFQTEGKEARVRYYIKASGTAIYPGDSVKLQSTGDVTVAATTDKILGVAMEYKASADVTPIAVTDDDDAVFVVQANFAFALADIGQNAQIVAGTADTTLFQSGQAINAIGTTATYPWRIIGWLARDVNEVGSFARVIVKPNEHQFRAGTTGV